MLKFVLSHRGGILSFEELEMRLGIPPILARNTLAWLEENGTFHFEEEINLTVIVKPGSGDKGENIESISQQLKNALG